MAERGIFVVVYIHTYIKRKKESKINNFLNKMHIVKIIEKPPFNIFVCYFIFFIKKKVIS